MFKAAEFGDDTDRPLQKSDGSWTYFAADVAYHLNKLERTKGQLINIFGADHGGYVKRMNAAVAALSGQDGMLDIKLCQLVNLLDKGKPVKMSKRAGTFVTVRDVIDLWAQMSFVSSCLPAATIKRLILILPKSPTITR